MLPLLFSLLLRVLWLRTFPVDPIGPVDAEGFHLLAMNMFNGHGFAFGWQTPYCLTALRTPGYPAVLAGWYMLVGALPERAIFLHLLLEVINTALIMHLARQLYRLSIRSHFVQNQHPPSNDKHIPSPLAGEGGWVMRQQDDRGARQNSAGKARVSDRILHTILPSLLAGIFYALNGLTPRYVGVLYAEILFVPVFLAALSATLHMLNHPRVRNAALAGLLWAMAILVKPNVQYLAILISGIVIVKLILNSNINKWKINTRKALIFIASLSIPLLLWIARNGLLLDTWRISTAFDENLARVSVPTILAARDGYTVEPWTATWEYYYDSFLVEVLGEQAWVFRVEPAAVCTKRAALEPAVTQAASKLVRGNIWLYIKEHSRGVLRGLSDPGHRYWYRLITGEDWMDTGVVGNIGQRVWWSLRQWAVWDALEAFWSQRVRDIPLDAALIWWGLILFRTLLHGLASSGLWRLRHKPWTAMLVVMCIGYIWLLAGPIAYERFFLPAMPLILVLATLAVGAIIQPAYNRAYPE